MKEITKSKRGISNKKKGSQKKKPKTPATKREEEGRDGDRCSFHARG